MPVEFDQDTITCAITFEGEVLQSAVPDVIITNSQDAHHPYALISGRRVPINEEEADALAINGAQDERHHSKYAQGSVNNLP